MKNFNNKQLKEIAILIIQKNSAFWDFQSKLIESVVINKKYLIKLNTELTELLLEGIIVNVKALNRHYKSIGGHNLDLFVNLITCY